MGILEEYTAYIKDNPEGYWFKRKLYGWGWTPARWQGWAVTAVYIAFVFALIILVSPNTPESEEPRVILLPILGATLLFLAITWKTGESLKWQWGRNNK